MATPSTVIGTVSDQRPTQAALVPPILYLYLIDADRNRCRYYTLCVQPGLFEEWSLRRSWGRIGTKGCDKTIWFASKVQAESFYERKRQEKLRRGYQAALVPMDIYGHMPAPGTQAGTCKGPSPSKTAPHVHRASPGQQELF